MIADTKITLKQAQTRLRTKEAVALAKNPIRSSKMVTELIEWAEYGDIRGATALQLHWIRNYVNYFRRKKGLQDKQINKLKFNRESIEAFQAEVIEYEGSLDAVYGEREPGKKNRYN